MMTMRRPVGPGRSNCKSMPTMKPSPPIDYLSLVKVKLCFLTQMTRCHDSTTFTVVLSVYLLAASFLHLIWLIHRVVIIHYTSWLTIDSLTRRFYICIGIGNGAVIDAHDDSEIFSCYGLRYLSHPLQCRSTTIVPTEDDFDSDFYNPGIATWAHRHHRRQCPFRQRITLKLLVGL